MVRAARAGFIETTDAVWDLLSKGEEVPKKVRAEVYASGFHVVEVGRDIASRVYAGGTRDAFMRDHPLEQALRDLHAIAYGTEVARFVQHSAGRMLLGGEHDHGL